MQLERDNLLTNMRDEICMRLGDLLKKYGVSQSSWDAELFLLNQIVKFSPINDMFGIALILINGSNDGCNEIYFLQRQRPEVYEKYEDVWSLNTAPDAIGEVWRKLLAARSEDDMTATLEILNQLRDRFLPKFVDVYDEWLSEYGSGYPEWKKQMDTSYKKVRRELKEMSDLFEHAIKLGKIANANGAST